jgi:uncharacterized protein involved in type VI secretion and phage assembly
VNKSQAASYDILVDGEDLAPEEKDRIKEICVVDYLRLPDVCTVHITYPRGTGIDSQPFEIGKQIEVRLGAPEALVPQTLFKGEVVTIEPEFGSGGCSVLVRAYDRSHVLHRSRHARTFQNQTSSDIVEKIVKEAGLTPKCDSSGQPHDFVQQDNESNWDFIWRLAERIGFEFVVDDTTAYFRKPTPEGAVELVWPDSLYSFRPRVTAVQQVPEVTLLAHDPKTKEAIQASAKRPEQIAQIGVDRQKVADAFKAEPLHVATEPVKTKAEADSLAQALLDMLANGYIAAEGVARGNPRITAGAKVAVSGVGSKFSGTYRVAMSMHVLRGGGAYETRFANSASHTILGAVGADTRTSPRFGSQLVLGVVTNNDDPLAMGRVRVKFPAFGDGVESAWARIATTSAGKERGLLMLPVVGEEVLIGFEHEDTTRPYVLGSLFNGKDVPGDDLLQQKSGSFALRSDAKIYTQSKQDYTIRSDKKLVIEVGDNVEESYKRDWTNETNGTASLKAARPFEIEGQNVTIKGNAQVSIEGTASLELKCGAASIQLSAAGVSISGPMINLG